MKKINVIYLTILLFSLISCGTSRRTQNAQYKQKEFENMMNSWLDETKQELLLTWGSPASIASDGNGGEILTFEELRRAYLHNIGYVTVVHRYMFYVNPQNIVYYWRYDKRGRQGH